MVDKKRVVETALLGVILLVIAVLMTSFWKKETQYQRFNTDSITYEKAIVTKILDQDLVLSGADGEYLTGYQKLVVKMISGKEPGKEIEIDHYVTLVHNVVVKKGNRVIVCADRPDNAEPYYTIYNYDRSSIVWIILLLLLFLIVLIGRGKGIRSAIGLCFTMSVIICYMIPALYKGKAAGGTVVITIVAASAVSCFCISGFEKKTLCNMISTSLGSITAGVLYQILAGVMNMNGGTMPEAESLQLISESTGMTLKGVMFAGIMVGALGAVMDVAVSMGAALWEIKEVKQEICPGELFLSGMNIGKDMIGTMTNTLILAFSGGCLPTLLIFISYGVQYHQLLSSNFLALELVQAVAGSSAVILTVPLSAGICSVIYGAKNKRKKKGERI